MKFFNEKPNSFVEISRETSQFGVESHLRSRSPRAVIQQSPVVMDTGTLLPHKRISGRATMLEDEIEDLVNELLRQENHNQQKPVHTGLTHANCGKCAPVRLAGTSLKCGVSTPNSPRCCPRLRCASCDFGVVVFAGKTPSMLFENSLSGIGRNDP